MANLADTDYCFLTTRLRSLENFMLTRERLELLLEAEDMEESLRILQECGYGELSLDTPESLEASLAAEREKAFQEVTFFSPDPSLVDIFRVKYDYHNLKALLKAEAQGVTAEHLLSEAGRLPASFIAHAVLSGDYHGIPTPLKQALTEAREVLGTTQDPQLADTLLDRAYYAEMLELAKKTGSAYLQGYVRLQIDVANLRVAVRGSRMHKRAELLRALLFLGGDANVDKLIEVLVSGTALEEFYGSTPLKEAAAAGSAALSGGSMTQFECMCDNTLMRYLATARYIPFGEQPIIFHLAAKELEFTVVRIIITGIQAGLKPDTIRERLREVYV